MPECSCGQPATEQVPAGHVRRGTRFVRVVVNECAECANESRREREIARAS